jgi:short-subunit dehydrogenase
MTETAVVTGGGGGLGQAFTRALAAKGYRVVPVDVAGTERVLDVTDAAACRALAEELHPAVWINNAGVTGAGALLERSDDDVERLVSVNLLGVIQGTRAAAATMLADGRGRILNIASLAGWAAVPHIAVYSATKNGVRAFSLAANAELRHTPVRIRCLLPDGIRTPMVDVTDARHMMSFTGTRLLEPDDVAAAGLKVLSSRRPLASVPHHRGATVRALGLFPSIGLLLQDRIEAKARRNQQRAIDALRTG